MVFLGREEEAVEALEVRFDRLFATDDLDPVDRRDLAVVIEARFGFAARLDQFEIMIVEHGGEVGGGARRHAGADAAPIHQDDRALEAGKLIGDR